MARIITVVLFYTFITLLNAQYPNIQFRHLSVKDGLSRSWVKCIYQDSDGFLWFGTEDGLNKYDGYSFKVYKHNSQLENSLNNNNINIIYEDYKKNLWVGTRDGLNIYNSDKDEFTPFSFVGNYVKCVYVYENGIQLIGTPVGLYVFDPDNNSIINVHSDNYILDILIDNDKNCWLATIDGLVYLNTSDYSYKTINLPGNINGTGDNIIHKLMQDSEGRIWIGTNSQGLFIMDYSKENPTNPTFHQYKPDPFNKVSVSQGAIYALLEDHNHHLWIGTENGGLNIIDLNTFDRHNCKFNYFTHDPYDFSSISNNSIHDIYMDKQNTIWIGVYGGGLNFYNNLFQKFTHIKQIPNNPNSLSDNYVNVIYEEDDYLWIGTEKGLNVLNRKTNEYTHYIHDYMNENTIGSNAIWAIFRDSRGLLWIGTWGGGLNLFNEKSKTFTRYLYDENDTNSIGGNNVFGIIEDKNGYLWISSMLGGLNRFDYKTQKFKRYKYHKDKTSISTDWVVQALESSKGEMWVATTEALDLFDRKTGTFKHFKNDPNNINSISNNGIITIFEDSKANIWLGTNNGLNIFHRKDSSFSCYQVKDGLPNNSIKSIIEDNQGNLWLGTSNGLSKFVNAINRPNDLVFINYDISDGLQGNEFNDRSVFKGREGEIYIGGSNGLNKFYPENIKENPYIPEVVFTDLLIFNKSVKKYDESAPIHRHINLEKEININKNQYVFSIEYAAINYISPEKNEYAYMLEGFDKKWSFVGTKRIATYTNLNPGKYIFKIKASNNQGIWNEIGKEIVVNILPAWWQTWLAKIFYIIIVIIALYIFRKFTIISTTTKNKLWLEHIEAQKIEELNKLKFRFFTNISHELRTPLTLISGPVSRLLKNDYANNELKLIKNNVSRLLTLVDQILDFRKIENDTLQLNLKNIDIIKLVENSFFNFTDLAEQKNISMVFESEFEELFISADKDKMQKIITNIVSNAIKYTLENGTVNLRISNNNINKSEKQLKISITDTGKGISKNNIDKIFDRFFTLNDHSDHIVGSGIGLHLTKKLVEIQQGNIDVESKLGKGSVFTITFPLYDSKINNEKQKFVHKKIINTEDENSLRKSANKVHDYSILIVDDNMDICNYLTSLLEDKFNIITETNPLKGMDKILEFLPDIIISDIMMPEMNGFELCENIKTDIRFSHIPVILLTAKATTEDRISGFDIGADEYINKPFDDDLLRSRIDNLLRQREQLKKHFIGSDGIMDTKVRVNSLDKEFIEKVFSIIKKNYKNPEFNMNTIIDEIGMSRSVFYRKYKSLSNQSINDLIRNHRLAIAKELLISNNQNISEIAYDCGFTDPGYFSKVFKEHFKISPKGFLKSLE